MNLATLCHDEATSTWSAVFNGETLVKSVGGESSRQYVIDSILKGRRAKVIKAGVTGFSNLSADLAPPAEFVSGTPWVPPKPKLKANNRLKVEERYELLDECVRITIGDNNIRSLIITGAGSVGKTFHTKEVIKGAGLLSTEEALAKAHTLSPAEQAVADRILVRMEECKKQAIAYYAEHGLPKAKKKAPGDLGELLDGGDDDEEDDEDEQEKLELNIGNVDFTYLHTSRDIKDRACGGQYIYPAHNYRFNIKLAVQNPDEYYNQVVPHEMAHHIQYLLFPKTMRKLEGHGKEWRKIMTDVFKIPADRFHTMDTTDVRLAPDLAGDYHYVKGYSSAKGLYRMLFENKHKIIVLDDCDAAWKNEVSANLLKSALDSDEDRWITWQVEQSANDDLPRRFLFEGKVIFISNVASEDFPQPLITRALRCDVELTIEERFERMMQILPSPKFAPGVPMEIRQMAYDFLWEHREDAAEISSRSLLNVIQVANSGSKLWQRIALSNIA